MVLDVSNNLLTGNMPAFRDNVTLYTYGNPGIGKDNNTLPALPGIPPSQPGIPPINDDNGGKNYSTGRGKYLNARIVLGSVIGAVCGVFIVLLGVCMCIRKRKSYVSIQNQSLLEMQTSDEGDGSGIKPMASKWSVSSGSEFGYIFNSI